VRVQGRPQFGPPSFMQPDLAPPQITPPSAASCEYRPEHCTSHRNWRGSGQDFASVLFTSGYPKDILDGEGESADRQLIAKPYDRLQLAKAVRAVLGQSP
jgi:hypothetical protein